MRLISDRWQLPGITWAKRYFSRPHDEMPTDVLMPQMGESIAEGTIVRWLKEVGERVDRDEPLFEISTDKVDAEIPSPAGGLLARVCAEAGATVPVNSVVAVIAAAGESLAVPDPDSSDPPAADGIEVLAGGADPVQADARPQSCGA